MTQKIQGSQGLVSRETRKRTRKRITCWHLSPNERPAPEQSRYLIGTLIKLLGSWLNLAGSKGDRVPDPRSRGGLRCIAGPGKSVWGPETRTGLREDVKCRSGGSMHGRAKSEEK